MTTQIGTNNDWLDRESDDVHKALKHRQEFERVFKKISSELIALPLDELESWANSALAQVGTFLGVDRVYIFLFNDAGDAIASIYEWCAKGVEYHPHEQMIGVTVDNFPWSMSHWTRGENVYVGNPEKLPEEAAPERGACEAFHIKSYINCPLFAGGKLHGWVGLDSVVEHNATWPQVDVTMATWVGESIINALFRRSRERALLAKQQVLEQEMFQRRQAQVELERAKTKLEEANRLKSIILANLSHELQTPLNGVVGYADLLSTRITDPTSSEMVEELLESADRLSTTLASMLELSELESELLKLEPQAVDLGACARTVASSYEDVARSKHVFLNIPEPAEKIYADVDEKIAISCINNIMDNAIKYTDQGGVTITCADVVDNDRHWGVIEIKDTGCGIPPEQLEYIFDEFRQGSEGDMKVHDGVGLGLSLSRKMVALMKGQLTVDSTVAEGTTFTIKLPAVEEQVVEAIGSASPQ